MMRKVLFTIALALAVFSAGQSLASGLEPCGAIDRESIKEAVGILAHEALGGRGTTQPGFDVAGLILARELRYAGLETLPTLNGSYFQRFQFMPEYEVLSQFASRNVIGFIPGSTDEYIIIGAHYDHVGIEVHEGQRKLMYPGADDNASGTAAVLEIARALGKMKHAGAAFRRNIIIAFWGAEEFDAKGSRHFVYEKTVPLEKIVIAINLDMVGRNNRTEILALGTWKGEFEKVSPLLAAILKEENAKLPTPFTLNLTNLPMAFCCSDHAPFFDAKPEGRIIPVLFFTSGVHADFHKPTDTPEKIDAVKIANVACLTSRIVVRLAATDIWPRYALPPDDAGKKNENDQIF